MPPTSAALPSLWAIGFTHNGATGSFEDEIRNAR